MILNSFALLDTFVSLLRLALACSVTGLSLWALSCSRSRTAKNTPGIRSCTAENRRNLLVLMAVVLLGLNIVAWPLLYALLQSYVSQWPGVMCIYGVTQIGAGSDGFSRFLPGILAILQLTKPLIVFFSGAWLVLYFANRNVPSSLLSARVLGLMALFGGLSVADAGLEVAYLVTPKTEHFLEVGCCSLAASNRKEPSEAASLAMDPNVQGRVSSAYFIVTGLLAAALGALLARNRPLDKFSTAGLLLSALVSLPISLAFLIHVASPTMLRLPYHHCAYCLMSTAPESLLALGALLLGSFSVGWLVLLNWSSSESSRLARRLLYMAFFGYLCSLVMFSAELWCA